MNPIFFICKCARSIRVRMYHKIYLPFILSELSEHGKDVVIAPNCRLAGSDHLHFGSHIYIGPGSVLYSTVADIYIGNYVNFGPNVSIFTGDHRTDVIGEYMKQLHDDTKLPENDLDVIIEDDVWIGSGAIILKGVTVGKGSVIAAGALVSKSVPPYTIYIGQGKQKSRFSESEIIEHEKALKEKYGN